MNEKTPKLFRFKCGQCDEWHEGAPSIGYDAPDYYDDLPAEGKKSDALLNLDFCVLNPDAERPDYFARCILEIPIHGFDEPFLWGVWSSLSKKSFHDYEQRFNTDNVKDILYTGWFSNRLPGYPDTINLKCKVHPQPGNQRPLIELEDIDHPLCRDFHDGISWERAKLLFERAQHGEPLS